MQQFSFLVFYRYGTSFKTISGEPKSVTDKNDPSMAWNYAANNSLLIPTSRYFNAYEFGLFYQCVPNKTYHFKNEQCTGGTLSEVKLTGMAEVNVNGERLPMVIGKSKTPRYFKGVKNVPCCYRTQPKSWISSELFEERVKEIDRNFGDQKRKITLIIDNFPSHPDVQLLIRWNWSFHYQLPSL